MPLYDSAYHWGHQCQLLMVDVCHCTVYALFLFPDFLSCLKIEWWYCAFLNERSLPAAKICFHTSVPSHEGDVFYNRPCLDNVPVPNDYEGIGLCNKDVTKRAEATSSSRGLSRTLTHVFTIFATAVGLIIKYDDIAWEVLCSSKEDQMSGKTENRGIQDENRSIVNSNLLVYLESANVTHAGDLLMPMHWRIQTRMTRLSVMQPWIPQIRYLAQRERECQSVKSGNIC